MTCSPSAQAPKSNKRQRSEQNGKLAGRCSPCSATRLEQRGQAMLAGCAELSAIRHGSLSALDAWQAHIKAEHKDMLIRIALVLCIFCLNKDLVGSELSRQLDAACRQHSSADIACVVMDAYDGRVIYQYQADQQRHLASVTKLLVSAAAFCELGPDYEMRTSLYRLGHLSNNSIPGLGIIGRGDPCLDEHFTDKKPNLIFERWAARLKSLGIQRVKGDLVIDASYFSGPAKPLSYPQDHRNQQQWYSAPASAFAWNDNCIEVRAVPTSPGKACRIEIRPNSPAIKSINKSKTVAAKGNKTFIVSRLENKNTVAVSGKYHKTTSWFPLSIHDNADQLAGDHCKYILEQQGIKIDGRVRIDTFNVNADQLLFEHSSKLTPALNILNQRSQNFYGEQILRILGQRFQNQGSVDFGCAAVKHYLNKHLKMPSDNMHILDGSGLSYDNKASARQIGQLLHGMHRHQHKTVFYNSLRTPTYSWAKKTPSRVKTGSLAIARCLAGYIDSKNKQRRYAFAILINKGSAKSFSWASKLREQLYKIMVQRLHR